MQFGFVRLVFKKSSKPNQTNAVRNDSVCVDYRDIKNMTILPSSYKINIRNFN
jgi:hypothetical protein